MLRSKQDYELLARQYAEKYGIVTYKVSSNCMIYNQNYKNTEYNGKRYVSKPCTYRRTVNLDTGVTTTEKLQRLVKNGWDNV